MINKPHFTKSVLHHFDFIITLYKFNYKGFVESGRDDSLIFTKDNLLLEVKYNYPNQYFDVQLFRNTPKDSTDYHTWQHLDIYWIVTKYNKSLAKEIALVKFETLEEIIEYKSSLLKTYGKDLLSGKDWFSWKDVSGWGKTETKSHIYLEIDGKVIQDYYIDTKTKKE